ncbi:MFS transporter [Bacillus sp. NPDC094106]|uniref:MFS transporter n=1 Tax=Bacillus sp. NPDC094106 TaxID=3363949 RepID=UPI0037FF5C90
MSSQPITYRNLLKQNSDFTKLFYGQTLSVLGDWFHTIALLTLVYSVTQSSFMLALTFMSKSLPQLLLSPFIGVIVDRFSKKKIMIVTDILRGVIVLTYLLAIYRIEIIFIANIILAVLSCLFEPAKQSSIKRVVKQNHLVTANSLSSTMNGFMAIIGASLGGITAQILSVEAAFFINSISFLLSAFFIFKTTIPFTETSKTKAPFFTDIKEGYTYILRQKIIMALILVGISWGIIGGAYQLLLTIYAESIFHAGNTGIGVLYTVQGAGLMIGSLLVNLYIGSNEKVMKKAFGWAYLWQGIFFLGFVLSDQLIIGTLTLLCMRLAGGMIVPLDTTLLQTYTKEEMIGKVFAFHYSIYGSLIQISMFITGLLLERISPQVIGSVLAVCCIFVSFIWLFLFYSGKLYDNSSSIR